MPNRLLSRAALLAALQQQQAENAALQAELAHLKQAADPELARLGLPPEQEQTVRLMQNLYSAIVLTDATTRIIWVSAGFTELCGFEPAEVLGQEAASVMRPNMQEPQLLAYIQARLEAHAPFQYDVPRPRPAGSTDWVRVRVQPIYNEQHEVILMAGMLEDITELKTAQYTLEESERQFQALAENVPGVLYQWRRNFDGTFAFGYVSPRLPDVFGIQVEDIKRMPEFIHPADLERFLQSMDEAVHYQRSWFFEGRLVVEGQPLRWMQGQSGVAGVDAKGIQYSGMLLDITPLKQAQTALREQDMRWRLAIDGFGDGAWEMHVPTQTVYFSPAYKAMLGYAAAEFANELSNWAAHVHPDDLPNVQDSLNKFIASSDTMAAVEYRMRCKNGAYKWIMSRAVATLRGEDGQAVTISGLHTDMTEVKATKDAFEATSRRLSTVIAHLQDGLVLEDEERRIIFTNDALCKLLGGGVTPAQLAGRPGGWLAKKTRPGLLKPKKYAARIAHLLRRRELVLGDVLKLRDGRTIRRDFMPIYDQDRYIGQLWKFEDITARTEAEDDLRRREEKYRGIIENMSLGLVEADLHDHLIYANQSFCELTGYQPHELAGRPLSPQIVHPDHLALAASKLDGHHDGKTDYYEIAITTKSGEQKWLLVSGAPLYDDQRRPVGSISIYLDVTPQKELEASLREAKAQAEISTRAKQDFLANMSHEIRTPMNAVLGMSQLLAKTSLHPTQGGYLNAITASAENLLVIINDILDLSKIEAGHMAIEHIGLRPTEVFGQLHRTLSIKAEEKGLKFAVCVGPGMPEILVSDPYRITQVLLNLAGNAIKFTEQGSVEVQCQLQELRPGGEALVKFTVADTGIGMEADYLKRVFDHFSQEDNSITRKFGGTGLGLGISRQLVALLGGELRISSEKHRGTVSSFELLLPVGTEADLPQADDQLNVDVMREHLNGRRVLVVEDNFFNRMLANEFLTAIGVGVTEVTNGQQAVEIARTQTFDLILMDMQMPVMDGYEATAALRQQLGINVPIIALTANAIKGEKEKCLDAGMNDYLTKPFQEASLMRMVYNWMVAHSRQTPDA